MKLKGIRILPFYLRFITNSYICFLLNRKHNPPRKNIFYFI